MENITEITSETLTCVIPNADCAELSFWGHFCSSRELLGFSNVKPRVKTALSVNHKLVFSQTAYCT